MRIAILGSTGRTGTLVLSEAVARGHQVTALVRAPGSLQNHRAVTMVEGDIYDPDALARTIDGTQAVISAVGARGRTKDLHTMLARNTITAMNSAGVERFVGVSVGGLDIPGDRKGPRDRAIGALARTLAGAASADRDREYQAWQASGLEWTLIRVPRLVDGEASTPPATDSHTPPSRTQLHRAALAGLLLDCATTGQFVRQAPFAADS